MIQNRILVEKLEKANGCCLIYAIFQPTWNEKQNCHFGSVGFGWYTKQYRMVDKTVLSTLNNLAISFCWFFKMC